MSANEYHMWCVDGLWIKACSKKEALKLYQDNVAYLKGLMNVNGMLNFLKTNDLETYKYLIQSNHV